MYKRVLFIAILAISVAACKQDNSDLGQKKAALETLIKEQSTLNDKVAKLRKEIDELDSTARSAWPLISWWTRKVSCRTGLLVMSPWVRDFHWAWSA